MAGNALIWDESGKKFYETGVDHGVLYDIDSEGKYVDGVAWNGLSAVNETPSGAEANDIYADNAKYLSLMSAEKLDLTIEAYTYPAEFEKCDGSDTLVGGVTVGQQARKPFGFCYRTRVGNDTDGDAHGYKLHLVYGCKASPSERSYSTVNDSPEAINFSWEVNTTPVNVTGKQPTSIVTIDSTKIENKEKLVAFEKILYGDTEKPRMPLPDEVASLLA